MHKYQPRVHVVRCPAAGRSSWDVQAVRRLDDVDRTHLKTFIFTETAFTAVTAYQNQLVCIHRLLLVTFNPLMHKVAKMVT